MPCKIKDLKEGDVISVWFGKGHFPVRGRVKGFAGGEEGNPKFIKAWVKNGKNNSFIRELDGTMEDEPKIFYLTEDAVTKVNINAENVLGRMGFKKL